MRANITVIICILAAVLLSQAVLAQSNQSGASILKQETRIQVIGDDVLVTELMRFSTNTTENVSIELPDDAVNVSAMVDNTTLSLKSGKFTLALNSSRYVRLSYRRTGTIDDDAFIGSFTAHADTGALRVVLTLPEKAVLVKPMEDDWGPSNSVLPKPKRLNTDGTSISVVWEFTDVKKDQDIAFYVKYSGQESSAMPLAIIILGLVVIAALALMMFMHKRHVPAGRNSGHADKKDVSMHLKDPEQQIINVLKLKEGKCEQGTLRVATGFSKTRLSVLLKELEERNVVLKEKRGKKNLVFLKG